MSKHTDLLEAALVGYQSELTRIEQAMTEIRRELKLSGGGAPAGPTGARRAKRKISAAGRKRMAEAQKRRWAEYAKRKAAAA